MKIVNEILYIQFQELVVAGVLESTIRGGKKRNSKLWVCIKDPSDRRMVLVQYETLREKYKAILKAKYGDPYQYVVDNHKSIKVNIASLIAGARQSHDELRTSAIKEFFADVMVSSMNGVPVSNVIRSISKEELIEVLQTISPNSSLTYTLIIK